MKANGAENGKLIDQQAAEVAYPKALDGGFGWVVVFSSFMIHFLADGVTYTFGIFYNELVKAFDSGKGLTAWVPSIMTGMTYLIGPVASGLTNKYGCRPIAIAGALLSSVGMLLGAISSNVIFLCVTIGICAGAGFGMIYLPAIVIVTCYFEERRAFATGLAVSGSGIGSAVMAPVTEWLIDLYGWRGGMMIVAAILLNCCVFGALMRPLEDSTRHQRPIVEEGKLVKTASKIKVMSSDLSVDEKKTTIGQTDTNHNLANSDAHRSLLLSKTFSPSRHSISSYNSTLGHSKTDQTGNGFVCQQHRDCDCPSSCTRNPSTLTRDEECSSRRKHSISNSSGILYRKDIFYSASLTNLQHHQSNSLTASYSNVNDLIMDEKNYVIDKDAKQNAHLFSCCRRFSRFICSQEVRDTLTEMMDIRLLGNSTFLVFSISNLLTSLGYYVPNIYIKDRSIYLKIASKHEASNLLAIIGISSSVGRLVFGFISDLKSINRLLLYTFCLTFSGLSTMISCLFRSYSFMALYCAFYGLTCGAYVSLTSVVLVDLLGLEKLTNAFGLVLLFQGFGCLVGPPIVGWFFDLTKSYTPGFLWAGSMMTIGGLILFVVPFLNKRNSHAPKTPLVVINTKEVEK